MKSMTIEELRSDIQELQNKISRAAAGGWQQIMLLGWLGEHQKELATRGNGSASSVRIGNGAIELDGVGGGVPIEEVKRVARLFEELFGTAPRIRLTGRYEGAAIGRVPEGDDNVDVWDLRKSMGSYCDVLHVGSEYLSVQLFTGLNNGRAAALAPARGTHVKLRFMLPSA